MNVASLKKSYQGRSYPTSDGRPMAESDLHRDLMVAIIKTLQTWFAKNPLVYVSGNLLVFYERGNRLKHISPDVLVVKGVPNRKRDNYLIWKEGKGLNLVIELTSKSTKDEDIDDKFFLYEKVLKVPEYFLFDPRGEYLTPSFQGFRLKHGKYVPIPKLKGRLPSQVLGLHLEQNGAELRLFNPANGEWLLTPEETISQERKAKEQERMAKEHEREAKEQERMAKEHEKAAREHERMAKEQERMAKEHEKAARENVEAENERLRQELKELRRQAKKNGA